MHTETQQQPLKYEAKEFQKGFEDLHYQIWNTFMKNTADDLTKKELRVMADSSNLLETFSKQKQEKDSDSTEECHSPRPHFLERQPSTRPNSPDYRMLARKSPRGIPKTFFFAFIEELKDIEDNCSPKTLASIKGLISEFKKAKDTLTQSQASQKRLNRKIQVMEKDHQDLIILRKVNEQAEMKLKKVEEEVEELKRKNKLLTSKLDNIRIRETSPPKTMLNISQLARFLNDKEKNINAKLSRASSIESNILEIVRTQLVDSGCKQCCSFLKKIKDSILQLRRSLLEESEQIETIYNKYKEVYSQGYFE